MVSEREQLELKAAEQQAYAVASSNMSVRRHVSPVPQRNPVGVPQQTVTPGNFSIVTDYGRQQFARDSQNRALVQRQYQPQQDAPRYYADPWELQQQFQEPPCGGHPANLYPMHEPTMETGNGNFQNYRPQQRHYDPFQSSNNPMDDGRSCYFASDNDFMEEAHQMEEDFLHDDAAAYNHHEYQHQYIPEPEKYIPGEVANPASARHPLDDGTGMYAPAHSHRRPPLQPYDEEANFEQAFF
jgi:hypothetical protein